MGCCPVFADGVAAEMARLEEARVAEAASTQQPVRRRRDGVFPDDLDRVVADWSEPTWRHDCGQKVAGMLPLSCPGCGQPGGWLSSNVESVGTVPRVGGWPVRPYIIQVDHDPVPSLAEKARVGAFIAESGWTPGEFVGVPAAEYAAMVEVVEAARANKIPAGDNRPQFAETDALLAIMDGDSERAQEIMASFLPGELARFDDQLQFLRDVIARVSRSMV